MPQKRGNAATRSVCASQLFPYSSLQVNTLSLQVNHTRNCPHRPCPPRRQLNLCDLIRGPGEQRRLCRLVLKHSGFLLRHFHCSRTVTDRAFRRCRTDRLIPWANSVKSRLIIAEAGLNAYIFALRTLKRLASVSALSQWKALPGGPAIGPFRNAYITLYLGLPMNANGRQRFVAADAFPDKSMHINDKSASTPTTHQIRSVLRCSLQ